MEAIDLRIIFLFEDILKDSYQFFRMMKKNHSSAFLPQIESQHATIVTDPGIVELIEEYWTKEAELSTAKN